MNALVKYVQQRIGRDAAPVSVDELLEIAASIGRVELTQPHFSNAPWRGEITFNNRNGSRICARRDGLTARDALAGAIQEAYDLGGAHALPK